MVITPQTQNRRGWPQDVTDPRYLDEHEAAYLVAQVKRRVLDELALLRKRLGLQNCDVGVVAIDGTRYD